MDINKTIAKLKAISEIIIAVGIICAAAVGFVLLSSKQSVVATVLYVAGVVLTAVMSSAIFEFLAALLQVQYVQSRSLKKMSGLNLDEDKDEEEE